MKKPRICRTILLSAGVALLSGLAAIIVADDKKEIKAAMK